MLTAAFRRNARGWVFCVAVVSCACWAGSATGRPVDYTNSTVRIRVETDQGGSFSVGNGSAFGVDLSAYGLPEQRYLLTAAHLVLSEDGERLLNGKIRVELPGLSRNTWVPCHVLAVTKVYDLCLLKCAADVPVISKLPAGNAGVPVGAKLLVVGCPLGVPPQVSTGTLADKEPLVSERYRRVWEANAAFNHGNSGGPVFSAEAGTVVGVAVAGVRAGGGGPQDMDPRIALFTPYYCVKHFLDVSIVRMAR
jgi:S1-C subfamily serine protease